MPKQLFQKGRKKTGGRVAGTPNKITAQVKQLVREALQAEGDLDYLRTVARTAPNVFCGLLGKLMASEIDVNETTTEPKRFIIYGEDTKQYFPEYQAETLSADNVGADSKTRDN